MELRVSDLQMSAWTWRVYDTVKARQAGKVYVLHAEPDRGRGQTDSSLCINQV